MGTFRRFVIVALGLLSFIVTPAPTPAGEWRDVTDDRLLDADSDPAKNQRGPFERSKDVGPLGSIAHLILEIVL